MTAVRVVSEPVRPFFFTVRALAACADPADLAAMAGHSVAVADARYVHALGRSHDQVRKAVR